MFWSCLQMICAVRNGGLGCHRFVLNGSLRCGLVSMFFDLLLPGYEFICEVSSVVLFCFATVPQTVPSWTPADRYLVTSALGRDPPDTDKICSIVLRDSSPLHNQEYAWPDRPGPGDTSSWREPQGFARPRAANQHRHKSRKVSPLSGFGC